MTQSNSRESEIAAKYHKAILLLLAGLFLIRLAALSVSPYNLHGDEAQYWAWSKDLDWGFFTKPPGIAAVIAFTTSIFGDAEWAVRISSPVLHSLTGYLIYRTARTAFTDATGFWAAAIYILMPAVWLSSAIVSTDVPLLFCWAVALNAWINLRLSPNWVRTLQLGLAIGLGLLCKYAMLFFIPPLLFALFFDPPTRQALLHVRGLLIAAIPTLLIAPNMMWNMEHDFATLSHTAANANLQEGFPAYPDQLLSFLVSQLGVFGPVTFGLFILAIGAAFKRRLDRPAGFLALFAAVPLSVIAVQAFISRANANWAVTSYIGASILLAHFAVKFWPRLRNWLRGGVMIQAAICLLLAGVYLMPNVVNSLGRANDVKRVRAWPATADLLKDRFMSGHDGQVFRAIAFDKRLHFYALNYYTLGEDAPLRMWMYKTHPENHAELSYPLAGGAAPVLLVNYYEDEKYQKALKADFERLIALEPINIDLGGGKRRKLRLWAGYGYSPTQTRH